MSFSTTSGAYITGHSISHPVFKCQAGTLIHPVVGEKYKAAESRLLDPAFKRRKKEKDSFRVLGCGGLVLCLTTYPLFPLTYIMGCSALALMGLVVANEYTEEKLSLLGMMKALKELSDEQYRAERLGLRVHQKPVSNSFVPFTFTCTTGAPPNRAPANHPKGEEGWCTVDREGTCVYDC
jgi:hypothetical protein